MHKTIIVTNKVKQIMYSTQTPLSYKGVETAAAISLRSYFNKYIVRFQDGSLCFVK